LTLIVKQKSEFEIQKLSYRGRTASRSVSVGILSTAE